MIDDSVARIPLTNLSPPDLAYLDRVTLDKEKLFADRVMVTTTFFEDAPSYRFMITGEQYATLAEGKGDFETALSSALRDVGSKLKKGEWKLEHLSEVEISAPVKPRNENETHSDRTRHPCAYEALFVLTKKAEKDARKLWPLNMTPPSWRGDPRISICVLADGEIPVAELHPEPP